jgi:putative hydrolase of the HAD superfamily
MEYLDNKGGGIMDILVAFDLDDTLYPELEFVHSGFYCVSNYLAKKYNLNGEEIYKFLIDSLDKGIKGTNFDILLEWAGVDEDVSKLVDIYRNHKPEIKLYPDSKYILNFLKNNGVKIALITDGYPKTQTNKINSLGIEHYFDKIKINDISKGITKKLKEPFIEILNELNIEPQNSFYIGDNPQKDFILPNALGMTSVRIIRENGIYSNINPINPNTKPKYVVDDLKELIKILKLEGKL